MLRQSDLEKFDPNDLREIYVDQGFDLGDIPEFIGAKEVPVRPPEEGTDDDQLAPEHHEPEEENDDLASPLLEGVVAVSLRVGVDIGNGHQADDDEPRQHDARHPRIEVDEHLLKTEEVPRRLRGIGSHRRVGRFFQWSLESNRPDDEHHAEDDHADELGKHEIRPGEDLVLDFALLEPRGTLILEVVVAPGFVESQPEEVPHQENHHHDGHVVGLGDHLGEVGVEQADEEKAGSHREHHPTTGLGP